MAEVVARLEVASSDGKRSIPIELGSVCSIGRGTLNTMVVEDESVSRKHAIIDCPHDNECYITDAGSRNGTFLNNSRVGTRTRLHHGDSLRIGTVPITFWFTKVSDVDLQSMAATKTTLVTAERYVTALVADIRDFTGLTRRLGGKRVSDVVGEFMRL